MKHGGAGIHIVGGGTVVYVRNHLALAAPAYGATAREIAEICRRRGLPARLTLTRMADQSSPYETNEDMERLAAEIAADGNTRILFWNPAICDFTGQVGDVEPGRKAQRLKTSAGKTGMLLTPANKIIGGLRRARPDIFLVAFKTTTGASEDEMRQAGLSLMKSASLVLVNDPVTRLNMVLGADGTQHLLTAERNAALEKLAEIALA